MTEQASENPQEDIVADEPMGALTDEPEVTTVDDDPEVEVDELGEEGTTFAE